MGYESYDGVFHNWNNCEDIEPGDGGTDWYCACKHPEVTSSCKCNEFDLCDNCSGRAVKLDPQKQLETLE